MTLLFSKDVKGEEGVGIGRGGRRVFYWCRNVDSGIEGLDEKDGDEVNEGDGEVVMYEP